MNGTRLKNTKTASRFTKMAKDTPLQSDLKEWALWVETQLTGASHKTVLYRAMSGELTGGSFGPSSPNIDASRAWMRRLILAMANLQDNPKQARYIYAVQVHYMLGAKKIKEVLGRPSVTLRRWRRQGEKLIELELRS